MRARHTYPLLFALPSAMASLIAAVLAVAAGAGVLWILVYGDDPWPPMVNTLLMAGATAVAAALFWALMAFSYRTGKAYETQGGVRRAHVLIALALSVGLPLLVALHQWQVGNLGHGPVPPGNSSKPALHRDSTQSRRWAPR